MCVPSRAQQFQSTPSTGRATPRCMFCAWCVAFQSTPSTGRATPNLVSKIILSFISIHALHGEGDFATQRAFKITAKFQSTPSTGRATELTAERVSFALAISIHALHREGDSCSQYKAFCACISIHALHREGDIIQKFIMWRCYIFQSTPSTGRATADSSCILRPFLYFNPRPPQGGRQVNFIVDCKSYIFQSTPSTGRATPPVSARVARSVIFQSTPSTGRATLHSLQF